jgi:hypothetical protein
MVQFLVFFGNEFSLSHGYGFMAFECFGLEEMDANGGMKDEILTILTRIFSATSGNRLPCIQPTCK